MSPRQHPPSRRKRTSPTSAQALSRLIREIGYEPVLIGGLAMGKHLMPGTPLAGERTPDQVRQVGFLLICMTGKTTRHSLPSRPRDVV